VEATVLYGIVKDESSTSYVLFIGQKIGF